MPIALKILLVALIYWFACWIGTLTFYKDFGIAIYWPAAGIAVLGVYFFGRPALISIFITSLVINYFIYLEGYENNLHLLLSISAISIGNTIAAFIGSQCLRTRVLKNSRSLFRLDSVLLFLLFVALIPALITSVTGGLVTYFSGVMPDLFSKIHSWMLADLLGMLLIIPFVFAWVESPKIHFNKNKLFEFLLITGLLAFTGYFIFTDHLGNYMFNFMIAYFTTPIYIWLALRFDTKAISSLGILSIAYISFLAIYGGNNTLGELIDKPYIMLQGFSILIVIIIFIVHSIFVERQQTLILFQKGEEKYRSLFENMPVSLWEDDYSEAKLLIDSWPDEIKNNLKEKVLENPDLFRQLISRIKIVDMNKSSLELYGETNKETFMKCVPEIFASGDPEAFLSVLSAFYTGTSNLEERIMEVKIKRKIRFLTLRWFIMPGHESDLSRILVTIIDITNLKKAEKEINTLNLKLEKKVAKRTEELNRANQELEAFSYSVSHDLKAPLRAIRGYASLITEEFGNDIPGAALHYFKSIGQNSEKMTNLITDLLQFSKLGRKSLDIKEVDSQSLVKNVWEDLTSLKKPANIEFIVHDLPRLEADNSLLTQVFVNLFSNSIKYAKPDSPGKITVSCKSDSEYHEFCVSDEGIGFDQKHAEKIFQVFQRLHNQDEYEGSGVGLALVKRIVHRHGGKIHVTSKKGAGSNFYFTIPVEIDSE